MCQRRTHAEYFGGLRQTRSKLLYRNFKKARRTFKKIKRVQVDFGVDAGERLLFCQVKFVRLSPPNSAQIRRTKFLIHHSPRWTFPRWTRPIPPWSTAPRRLRRTLADLRGPAVPTLEFSKSSFLLFMIELSPSYQILFTRSKNIDPSQSYHIFKS